MTSTFLCAIDESIKRNLDRNAVLYYCDNVWGELTYKKLLSGVDEVITYFDSFIDKQCGYVVLFLKISKTLPILFLSLLKKHICFICLEEGQDEELSYYLSKFSISYVLSNALTEKTKIVLNYNLKPVGTCVILNENISYWTPKKSSEAKLDIPDSFPWKRFMYSIKTSGSTGSSKIIHVSHNCIVPNIKDLSEILEIKSSDIILFMTPVTFDPSVVEVLLSLYNGCTLCILDKKTKEDPLKIIECLFPKTGGVVTILQTTPSILKRWTSDVLKNIIFHLSSSLRAILLGGEEFPASSEILSWNPSPHINIYNIYGITEVSCWASINKVWPADISSTDIGIPLSETLLQLKNTNELNEGELLIGSKTRICLVGDENCELIFNNEAPIFRETGDLFKEVNGKLFFVARTDDIIKRWGTRVSLSEIERVSRLHENIQSCSCVYIKLPSHIKVCLFIVQKVKAELNNFQHFLKKRLPKASWPDELHVVFALPLTKHGKISKGTLRRMCVNKRKMAIKDYFNDLWQRYTDPGSEANFDFLSSGGDSFTAIQFLNELKHEFRELPDTFLGYLLQKKTKEEVWDFINSSCKKISYGESSTEHDKTSLPGINSTEIPSNSVNVLKTYLKGRTMFFASHPQHQLTGLHLLKLQNCFVYNLRKCVDASPLGITFLNGRNIVIIGSHSGDVLVLDIDSLNVISMCRLPHRIESSACVSPCGKFYYLGCYDGFMYAIDIESGNIVWAYKTDDMIKNTAVIHKKDILFGSYDRHVYCLNKRGVLLWKTQLKSPILAELIIAKYLYSVTLGSVAALNIITGQLLWEYNHYPVFSNPVLSEDYIILADVKGHVEWLNKETGNQEYSFEAGDMIFSSLVYKTTEHEQYIIFGCHDSYVYCLKNKVLHWKTLLDSKITSTPFLDFTNIVACVSSKGKVYLLEFSSGNIICDYVLPGEVFSSPIIISNKIVIGCRDDNVHILELKNC